MFRRVLTTMWENRENDGYQFVFRSHRVVETRDCSVKGKTYVHKTSQNITFGFSMCETLTLHSIDTHFDTSVTDSV